MQLNFDFFFIYRKSFCRVIRSFDNVGFKTFRSFEGTAGKGNVAWAWSHCMPGPCVLSILLAFGLHSGWHAREIIVIGGEILAIGTGWACLLLSVTLLIFFILKALVKQFAEILHFTLTFDDLKVGVGLC